MIPILFVAAQAAAAASSSARPLSSPTTWLTAADYPADALAERRAGLVGFGLEIDRQGHVTGCRVTMSSGVPSLDAATCVAMFQKGRFEPAMPGDADVRGYGAKLRWTLPGEMAGLLPPRRLWLPPPRGSN